MNPHQRNKIDVSKLSPDEQKIFRLYGKVPNTNDLLQNKFKERKYFDSGDYALSKAGKASDVSVTTLGHKHPQPENIPHLSSPVSATNSNSGNGHGAHTHGQNGLALPPGPNQAGSPVKESSFLHREQSADDPDTFEQSGGVTAPAPVSSVNVEQQGQGLGLGVENNASKSLPLYDNNNNNNQAGGVVGGSNRGGSRLFMEAQQE